MVEYQGITAAARALDVPKSGISRRILSLEASLGARLIQRTSRRFVVTEIGAEFHRHALAMLVEAEVVESVVRRRTAEPSGTLRFTCPVAFAQLALADLIPRFMAVCPRVRIVQHATNRYVDPVQEGSGEVEQGQLVRVLPQWIAGLATMTVLMPSRRGLLPSVGAFVEFLAEHVPTAVQ